MAEFPSLYSYCEFAQAVQAKATCVRERAELSHGEHDEKTQEFLSVVRETSTFRQKTLLSGSRLFRAQVANDHGSYPVRIGFDEDDESTMAYFETPCSAKRMLPDATKVGDGRANRKGIPYLYLAEKRETAMAETRPWVRSLVTLATFMLSRDCRVIDCSRDTRQSFSHQLIDGGTGEEIKPDAQTRENGVWGDIGNAFSKPVRGGDEIIEYAPTQVLAEEFQSHGYDGIVYKSLLDGGGDNVVLFDTNAAKQHPVRCLYKTTTVLYEFDEFDQYEHEHGGPAYRFCPRHILSRYSEPDIFGTYEKQSRALTNPIG
jgi:hypothetical protein